MKFDKNTKILIVGLGLIGGSYAKALSDEGYFVGAIDKQKSSVEYALKNGLIQVGETSVKKDFVKDFDLIVFALYPHDFINWIKEYQSSIKPGALITDVTGVKSFVVENVQKILRGDLEFVGAHPMAGKEVSGVENADPKIFVGANYIVTPTKRNTDENVQAVKDLGRALGFERISSLSPEEHDETVGFLSHLTHCIAVSLMVSKKSHHLAEYTGDSFRDLTRIAKINDEMWSELFLANKDELLKQMDLFEEKFNQLREDIKNDNREKIRETLRESTARRKVFDKDAKETK